MTDDEKTPEDSEDDIARNVTVQELIAFPVWWITKKFDSATIGRAIDKIDEKTEEHRYEHVTGSPKPKVAGKSNNSVKEYTMSFLARLLISIAAMLVTLFVVFYVALVVTGAYDAARIIGFFSGMVVSYWLFNFKLKS